MKTQIISLLPAFLLLNACSSNDKSEYEMGVYAPSAQDLGAELSIIQDDNSDESHRVDHEFKDLSFRSNQPESSDEGLVIEHKIEQNDTAKASVSNHKKSATQFPRTRSSTRVLPRQAPGVIPTPANRAFGVSGEIKVEKLSDTSDVQKANQTEFEKKFPDRAKNNKTDEKRSKG